MTDRELMQMALLKMEYMLNNGEWYKPEETIEALRARLAQPEPEPVWVEVTTNTGDKFILDSAVEADKIRAARDAGLLVVPLYTAPPHFLDPAKVARLIDEAFERGKKEIDMEQVKDIAQKLADCAVLNSAPPQREWQGLTDEEVRDLWSWSMTAEAERTANTQQHAFARAIEAKLKEKNHAI